MRKKYIPSSSRRKARSISLEKMKLMEDFYPSIKIDLNNLEEISFQKHKKISLEIGFGDGEHLIHQAENNPDVLFIGCEVFYNGLCTCVYKIHKKELKNILIFDGDVRLLLEKMPHEILSRIFILFPDPWPKTRHEKKRLINKQTLDLIYPLIKNGGVIRIATDHPVYFNHVLKVMVADKRFKLLNPDHSQPKDHTITKYQQKALDAGRGSRFLEYIKV